MPRRRSKINRPRISKASTKYPKYPGSGREEINRFRRTKIRDDKFLTIEQMEHLFAAIDKSRVRTKARDYALIFCAFHMGLRASEVVQLNVEESLERLDDNRLMIRSSKRKDPDYKKRLYRRSTKCADRNCPRVAEARGMCIKHYQKWRGENRPESPLEEYAISDHIRGFLEEYVQEVDEQAGDTTWLFPSSMEVYGHITIRMAELIFDRYVRLAKLPVRLSFHALRHSFGVMVQRKFHDVAMTKRLMRHTSEESTHVYIELSDDEAMEAMEGLEGIG